MKEFTKGTDRGAAPLPLLNLARRAAKALASPERDFTKLRNIALCKLSLALKLDKNLGKPYSALIETSNLCNLECPLCPTGENTLNRKPQNMSFETFKKIVDQMARYCVELNLTNYGEPLLNKEIYDMIYYAKQKKIRIIMGTNAHFLKDDKDRRCLIMSGVDEVYVSLDGTNQSSYETYRRRGDFSLVVENVKRLIELKRKMQVDRPLIELQCLIMKHNEHEIDGMRKLANELGADQLSLKPVGFNNADWGRDEIIREFLKFEPTQEEYRIYKHTNGGLGWDKEVENSCRTLWSGLTVLADGTIVPCCLDPRADMVLGHIDEGIVNVWNGDRYRKLRRQITRDKKQIELCSNCLGM